MVFKPKEEITTHLFWECPKLDYVFDDRPIKNAHQNFYLFINF
jgi:hypothetical protein